MIIVNVFGSCRRQLRRACLAGGMLVVFWLVASWLCVFELTRRPRAAFAEPAPAVSWGTIEPVRLRAVDGQTLGAWFVPETSTGPSVLLLHGNGECRGCELPRAQFFAQEGCSVLLLSLRAHGDSTGEVNDIGYEARHDVVAAVDFLARRRPGRPIIVQGTSLGAAAALYAAGTLGNRVQGYVLESPYADLRTAARNRTENYLPFPLDRIAYAGLALAGPLVLPDLDRMAPVDAITAIPPTVPVLLLAGGRDRLARPEEARSLYSRVRGPARLAWFPEAGHESYYARDPARYAHAVRWLLHGATSVSLRVAANH